MSRLDETETDRDWAKDVETETLSRDPFWNVGDQVHGQIIPEKDSLGVI